MATVAGLKTGQGRRLYVNALKETTFGTALSPAVTHILEHAMKGSHLDVTKKVIRGGGWTSGINTDVGTKHITESYSMSGRLILPAAEITIPMFLAKAMNGNYTPVDLTGKYGHTLAWPQTPDFLCGMTVENHIATATPDASYDRQLLGCCVDNFKFHVGIEEEFATVEVGLLGSGKSAAAADPTEGGLTKPAYFITLPMCRFLMQSCPTAGTTTWDGTSEVGTAVGTWGTADTGATDISSYIESFDFEVANNGTLSRQAGVGSSTGLYAGQVMPGIRTVTVRMKVKQGTAFDAVFRSLSSDADHEAQGEYMISMSIASKTANCGGMITFPLCALLESPSGGTGPDVMRYDYSFEARAGYPTYAAPIAAYFVNPENVDYC
jgi:hypothetical protein